MNSDRVLGTRLGFKAVEMVEQGEFGKMVALSGEKIVSVPLEKAIGELKLVDRARYELAEVFFG